MGKFRSQNATFQSENSPLDVFWFSASFDSKLCILFPEIAIFEGFLCPKIHFLTPNPFSSKKRHFWGHKMIFFVRKQHFCLQVLQLCSRNRRQQIYPKFAFLGGKTLLWFRRWAETKPSKIRELTQNCRFSTQNWGFPTPKFLISHLQSHPHPEPLVLHPKIRCPPAPHLGVFPPKIVVVSARNRALCRAP